MQPVLLVRRVPRVARSADLASALRVRPRVDPEPVGFLNCIGYDSGPKNTRSPTVSSVGLHGREVLALLEWGRYQRAIDASQKAPG
jgi:hypothetical protein